MTAVLASSGKVVAFAAGGGASSVSMAKHRDIHKRCMGL